MKKKTVNNEKKFILDRIVAFAGAGKCTYALYKAHQNFISKEEYLRALEKAGK